MRKGLQQILATTIVFGSTISISAGLMRLCGMDRSSSSRFEVAYNGQAKDEFYEALRGKILEYRNSRVVGAAISHSEQENFFYQFLSDHGYTMTPEGKILDNQKNRTYYDQLKKELMDYKPRSF